MSLGQVLNQVGTNYKAWTLYRTILRYVPKLPNDAQPYYRDFAKQHFVAHQDEDHSRGDELVKRGYENFKWVLAKYDVELDESDIPQEFKWIDSRISVPAISFPRK